MNRTETAGDGADLRSAVAGLGAGLALVATVYAATVAFATDPLTVLAGFVGATWIVGVAWIVVTAIRARRSADSRVPGDSSADEIRNGTLADDEAESDERGREAGVSERDGTSDDSRTEPDLESPR